MSKREAVIKIRLSDSELMMIREKMEEYGTDNMSAFVRKMAIDGHVVKLELPELREIIRLLRSCSNNLNQIAKRVNSGGSIYAVDMEEILQTQEDIWNNMEKILRSLSKIK